MPLDTNELARLQLRITAEGEQYLKVMKDIQKETHHTTGMMEHMAEKAVHFSKELGGDIAGRLLGGLGIGGLAGGMATGIVRLMENAVEVAERYEKAEISLNAVLEANHRNVNETREDYEKFAQTMDQTTTLTELQALQLLKTAESFRLTGEAAKSAVKDASSLSAATGHDPQAMMRVTAAVEEGNLKQAMSYGRLIPQLRGIKDEEKWLIEYNNQINAGAETQAKLVDTTAEKWAKFREGTDKAEIGLGRLAEAMAEVALRWAKAAGAMGAVLQIFEGLGKRPSTDIKLTEEGQAIYDAAMEKENREKAQRQQAHTVPFDYDKQLDKLRDEAKYIGLSADETERERMAALGLSQAKQDELIRLENYIKLQKQIHDLDEKFKYHGMKPGERAEQEAMERGATAEEQARIRRKYDDMDLTDKLKKVKEEIASPQEKLAKEMEQLDKLFHRGALFADEYAEAVQKARDKLLGMAQAVKAADGAFSGAHQLLQYGQYAARPLAATPPAREGDSGQTGTGGGLTDEMVQEYLRQIADAVTTGGARFVAIGGSI